MDRSKLHNTLDHVRHALLGHRTQSAGDQYGTLIGAELTDHARKLWEQHQGSTIDHIGDAINAAIFAANHAGAALFCLLQKTILSDTEHQAARPAFDVMATCSGGLICAYQMARCSSSYNASLPTGSTSNDFAAASEDACAARRSRW